MIVVAPDLQRMIYNEYDDPTIKQGRAACELVSRATQSILVMRCRNNYLPCVQAIGRQKQRRKKDKYDGRE
jgi:hypothetical protein